MSAGQFLARVPLFSQLADKELEALASQMTPCSFSPGTDIVREGDQGDGLYIIQAGMVKVSKKSASGQGEAALALLKAGDFFGEMALLDDQPRSATVSALGPTQCLFLSRTSFVAVLEQHPQIAVAMLPVLTQRIRTAERWVESLI